MSVVARRVLSVMFALALVVGGNVLGGTPASAEVVHNFEFSFDESATPSGSFENSLSTVALDQASGDVYVAVAGEKETIYRFDATGNYLGEINGNAVPQGSLGLERYFSGMAVDNSAGPNKGDLYVSGTENGVVYKFDATGKLLAQLIGSGTPAGSFTPNGIAIDASGDVYIADSGNDVVDELDPSGGYLSQMTSPEIIDPATIAVDSNGNVYLNNDIGGTTLKLEPGDTSSVLDASETDSVTVDPATGHVYVAEREYPAPGRIAEYDSSGKRLGVFGEARLGYAFGIAVQGATGRVYAADYSNNLIDVFGADVVVPDVTSEPASNIQPTGATLNGTVNPDGLQVSNCELEYGTSTSYGQSVPCTQSPASIGSGTSPVTVSASLSGLQPDTEYHYRLVSSNANGVNRGADATLTTTGPPQIESESVSDVTHIAATLEGQIDPSDFDTTYRFEYGASTSYGTSVPVPNADIGLGITGQAISQDISGLLPGVTYHYRVVATNSQGTVNGADREFTTVPPASIDAQYATDVASTSATIDAEINPIGSNTEYRLEYGTSTAYGHTLTGNAGEGATDLLVSYHLQELRTSTTYHYRFVVTNAYGVVQGPDKTFITQVVGEQELTLPDGRAWELVSPPDKKGALIESFGHGQIQAASGGVAISYLASEPLGENLRGNGEGLSQLLSVRRSGAWSTEDVTVPGGYPEEGQSATVLTSTSLEYGLFSSELSAAIVEPPPSRATDTIALSPEATERTLYLRDDLDGSFTPLVTQANVPPGTKFGGEREVGAIGGNGVSTFMHFLAATPDLSHIVLASALALTPEATSEITLGGAKDDWNLYEWSGGKLQLINILPNGQPHARAALGRSFSNGNSIDPKSGTAHTVSNDGRWIVWSPEESSTLYVRDMVEKKTVQVGGSNALFETMSSDGSRVFFLENGDLYEFDVPTATQTDLTANHGPSEDVGVKDAILGASEDGSYVYFVATSVLAPGAGSGEDNLYVTHDTGGEWTVTHVATLSSEDEKSWYWGANGRSTRAQVDSRVSPDGRYVAFMSERSLTGYDNVDAVSAHPDEEVYLYDADAGRLICASCNPTGARPIGMHDVSEGGQGALLVDRNQTWMEGGGNTNGDHWLAGMVPGWDDVNSIVSYQPRYLSDSGRLFFDSPDALVPQDTNGLMDVYEYEPGGIGSCTSTVAMFSERLSGCVSLISAGTSFGESAFYDASETGDDAFFITASQLVAADYDTSYDVYDAHVCSVGAPCAIAPVSQPPCTSGDSCKAAPSPQPTIFGTAPSATFSGVGNVASPQPAPAVKQRSLTRKQRLTRALKACRSKHIKKKRVVCERQARKRYGAKQSRAAHSTRKGSR